MKSLLKEIKYLSHNLKVLYVEDDDKARATTLEMLENFFDAITVSKDGEEALSLYQNKKFDIIITDINMPHLNGISMLKEIRKDDTKISVIILSAYDESDYFLDAIKLDVDGFVLKPLKFNQFVAVIEKVVHKIHSEKKVDEYHENLELEVKERTKELQQKLYYDDLTGLLNRYSFFEDIKFVATPILFMIDINKFKLINEIYGTQIGSLVLKEFAKFLQKFTANKNYKTYRLSADEFIIWDNVESIDFEKYEEELQIFFNDLSNFSVNVNGDSISIEVTIGISTSQEDAFESAKIALEYAKLHKKPYTMYATAIDKRKEEQDALLWKDKIKIAIKTDNVVPVYQAIVDKHEKIMKYETLMRLRDEKTQELVSPFYFLNISIKTGLYSQLSSYIIFSALYKIHSSGLTLSINFTYSDINNTLFIDSIEEYIKKYHKVGTLAVFEITESESIENYDDVKSFTKRFRKYGVRFAIDDFGSGFSNFEYILEIEPDFLKIDGSLIKNIDTDEKSLILVRAIVQFSHELGIKTIAEYVHSKTIFNILKALNIDEFQGFYFSQPHPVLKE